MKSVIERMEEENTAENIELFRQYMLLPYEAKKNHAEVRAWEFVNDCAREGLNYHVSVGGLDSITLLLFLRNIGIDAPAISVSGLEDISIQRVHKQLGVERLQSAKRDDGKPWTKAQVIQNFGFPVLSKEIAAKIDLL